MSTLTATPVRLHHVPDWLRRRCLKAFGTRDRYTDGWHVIFHALESVGEILGRRNFDYCGWFDHWGSTVLEDGTTAFVTEPYYSFPPDDTYLEVPRMLAEKVNCRLVAEPHGAWNDSIIRLLFIPNDQG